MQKPSAFFLCLLLVSCELIGTKDPTKEQLFQQEMQSINWNDVDRYPLFEDCSENDDKQSQKICFQTTFINHLLDTLQEHQIIVHRNLNDTVGVQLLISKEGEISILSIEKSANVTKQIPQLDSLLHVSLKTLPRLHPALKRNIPVATRIKLPIVLKSE